MEIDTLRMFVKVAELGSFTQAAAHLGLSKAVSYTHLTLPTKA